MKKLIIAVCSVVIVFVIVCTVYVGNVVYKMWYVDSIHSYDVAEYTENRLSKYDFGDTAQSFFPQYSSLGGTTKLYYHYFDGRHKTTYFHEYYTSFTLDITYEKDMYNTQKAKLISENEVSDDYVSTFIDQGGERNVRITVLEDSTSHIKKVFGFFDDTCTVKYYLLCSDNSELQDDFTALSHWNDGEWE